jgi:hypothetical protein
MYGLSAQPCTITRRNGRLTMSSDADLINDRFKGTLAETLGMRVVEATRDRVVAELTVREALTTVGGSLHGGTLMALPTPSARRRRC